ARPLVERDVGGRGPSRRDRRAELGIPGHVHVVARRERLDPAGDAATPRAVEEIRRLADRGHGDPRAPGALAVLDPVALVGRGPRGGRRKRAKDERRQERQEGDVDAGHTILLNQSPESSAPAIRNPIATPPTTTVISRFFFSFTSCEPRSL